MEGEKKEGTRKGLGVREEEIRGKTGTGRDRARQTVQDRWTGSPHFMTSASKWTMVTEGLSLTGRNLMARMAP